MKTDKELQAFNHELLLLLDKYDAEFVVDFGYDSDIHSIDVQMPDGWIVYQNSGSRLCSHDLRNPKYIVDGAK